MILGADGNPINTTKASYDAATLKELDQRFKRASGSSADVTDSFSARSTLRNRARFEVRNNSYAMGLVRRLSFEIVGSCPKLSLMADNNDSANEVEKRFTEYLYDTESVRELHQAFFGWIEDGETFGQFQPDRTIQDTPIRLRWYEPDQWTDGLGSLFRTFKQGGEPDVDGISFDEFGNPKSYKKLKYHPGGNSVSMTARPETIGAENVVHLFFPTRPGQHRGVSLLAPCLPLFTQLREYTAAVLAAAETAADHAAIMKTNNPNIEATSVVGDDPFIIPIRRKAIIPLPDGYDLTQLRAEQPTSSHAQFTDTLLREIYNCVVTPFSIGAADSKDQNFASGKLDHNGFYRAIDIIRHLLLERLILNRLFNRWMEFAVLNRWFPSNLGPIKSIRWFYDRREPLDPQKEASAVKTLSETDMLNEEAYFGSYGHTPESWYQMKKRVADAKRQSGFVEPPPLPEEGNDRDS